MGSYRRTASLLLATVLIVATAHAAAGQAAPAGEAVIAWHVTIAPSWFDPSTAPPQITPFGILYALHDALVRPLPGHKLGNSLAESWRESPDGLVYEFKLRRGVRFHNGEPVTAEDGYPDIDDLALQQARERDPRKREALLHRIQQLTIDRVMFAPIMDYRTLRGVGPRVAEHMLDTQHLVPYPAWEELRLKGP